MTTRNTRQRTPAAEYSPPTDASPASRATLNALLVLFVLSGVAALIYEIIWFQLLELVIGSSAISLGVLLATYMGGMCLGSLLLPRVRRARDVHPLRLYALLELGIGIGGLFVLAVVPLMSGVYSSLAGNGPLALLIRAVVCAVCLLPPTVLMGATLPAASRFVEATPNGIAWIGFLYGGNTVGAVFGSILAGFYLLRVYDVTVATLAAVAINALVATTGLLLVKRRPAPSSLHAQRSTPNAQRT